MLPWETRSILTAEPPGGWETARLRWPLQRRPETLMPAPPWCVQEPGGRQGSVDWPRDPCMADYYEPLHPMLPGLVRHVFEAEVVDLCIHTHTWMCVYIDICKYIDVYVYIYIDIHTHTHTYIHIYVHIYVHINRGYRPVY